MILTHNPTNRIRGVKLKNDEHLVQRAASEVGVAIPVSSSVKEIYRLAIQQGLGEQDFSAIYSFLKQ
ncbi:MAG: hypothetical protein ACFB2X_09180 [Rivularia sp. (in: cyanobacteria)]